MDAPLSRSEAPIIEVETLSVGCDPTLLAVVDGEPLGLDAFNELLELKRKKYTDRKREIPATTERRYRESLSTRLIHQHLIALELDALGLRVDARALAQCEEDGRRGVDDWAARLADRGESEASLRAIYATELGERAILEARAALDISEAELEAEYDAIAPRFDQHVDRVRASFVLIPIEPSRAGRSNTAEVEREAERIAALLRAPGVDVAAELDALAREFDPTGERGGSLAIYRADRLDSDLSKAAFAAKPGEILVVHTSLGHHVLWVVAHYGPGRLPLDALRDSIVERLDARKLLEGRRALADELLDRHRVRNCEAERLELDE